jgi:hypothetical protein
MVTSSVSPDRVLIIVLEAGPVGRSTASSVSVSEPIWFTLTRHRVRGSSSRAAGDRLRLVTNRSSPTI